MAEKQAQSKKIFPQQFQRAQRRRASAEPRARAPAGGKARDGRPRNRGLGVAAANDAYASAAVISAFEADHYHSPRVVWGREVNLIILGLARQITSAFDPTGALRSPQLASYVESLAKALESLVSDAEASGLRHNELWTYEISGDRLAPKRYGATSDIQLWNLTRLAADRAARTVAALRSGI